MCCDLILQTDFNKTCNIDKLSITMIILCKGKLKKFIKVLVGCQRMRMMILIIYKVEYILNL